MKLCQNCNAPISEDRSAKAKYCTSKCMRIVHRDNAKRTCSTAECVKPVRARNLCASHYNKAYATERHAKVQMECAWCGDAIMKHSGGSKRRRPVCSNECRQRLRTPYCKLPNDHWVMMYGKSSKWTPPKVKAAPPKYVSNTCDECGTGFVEYNPHSVVANYSRYCSDQCSKRVSRRTRKAREHNATGTYRWIEVIRLWVAAGRQCSYCDVVMTEQPDPDHVTPLSRGGRNDIGNILPCCHLCNSDKCDMTLDEWAVERIRLGKRPLRYVLDYKDPRFKHLTLDPAIGSAWRHSVAA